MFELLGQKKRGRKPLVKQQVGEKEDTVIPDRLPIAPAKDFRSDVTRVYGGALAPIAYEGVDRAYQTNMHMALQAFRANTPRYDIGTVAFNFMSSEMLKNVYSVVHCRSPGFTGLHSINSPRMGTIDQHTPCMTCGLFGLDCPGHLGHIELAVPLPHPLAVDLIAQVLQSICSNCGRLLLPRSYKDDPNLMRLKGIRRLAEVSKIVGSSNIVTCPRNLELAVKRRDVEEKSKQDDGVSSSRMSTDSSSDTDLYKESDFCPPAIWKYVAPKDTSEWNIKAVRKDSSVGGGAGKSSTAGKKKGAVALSKVVDLDNIECVFNSMTPEDLAMLGFSGDSHPRNFIIRALPVLPEQNRPSVDRDGEKKHDHITLIYGTIIRQNDRLERLLRELHAGKNTQVDISTCTQQLYFCISHLMINSDGAYTLNNDEAMHTISARLAGKDGFCRAVAQGKRVDNAGRSVISPGVMPFGTVVIPYVMRMLTVPERVNFLNMPRILAHVENGEIVHVTRNGNRMLLSVRMAQLKGLQAAIDNLRETNEDPAKLELLLRKQSEQEDLIKIGDVIERLGQAGDEMLINRQPTLHRHSLIGVRALHKPGQKTIKLHMSYTTPANADFDGDEMNIGVPQTARARAEVRYLIAASKQIVSAADSSTTMGLVFNCPIAAFLLSMDADKDDALVAAGKPRPKTVNSKHEWAEIVNTLLVDNSRAKTLSARLKKVGVAEYSPRALFSLAFPDDFYYESMYEETVTVKTLASDAEREKTGEMYKFEEKTKKHKVLFAHGVFVKGILGKKDVAKGIIHTMYVKYGGDVTGRFISEGHYLLDWYLERRGYSLGLADCLLADPKAAQQAVRDVIAKIRSQVATIESGEEPKTETERLFKEIEIASILRTVTAIGKKLGDSEIVGGENPLGAAIVSGAKGGPSNIAQIAGALGEQFVYGERPRQLLYGKRCLPYFEADDTSIEARGFVTHSFAEGMMPSEFFFHMEWARTGLLDTAMRTADIGAINHRISKVLENDRLDYYGGVVNSADVYTSLSYAEGYDPTELMSVKGFKSTGPMYMPFHLQEITNEINYYYNGSGEVPTPCSPEEIEDIVSCIPPVLAVSQRVADHNLNEIKNITRLQLAEIKIIKSGIPELKARIFNRCRRAEVHPGETVGLHAAEAISQPITQATLNTFHNTGGSTSDIGLHAFSELLNLSRSRKKPTANIHFKNLMFTRTDAMNASRAFVAISLKSLLVHPVTGMSFSCHNEFDPKPAFYDLFKATLPRSEAETITDELTSQPFLRLMLNPYSLFESRVTTAVVADAIEETGGVRCIYSPTSEGIVDVFYNIGNTTSSKIFMKEIDKVYAKELNADSSTKLSKKQAKEQSKDAKKKMMEDDKIAWEFLTPENKGVIFQQMFLIPRINNESLVVSSKNASAALEQYGSQYGVVPPAAGELALFKKVDPEVFPVMTLFRGIVKMTAGGGSSTGETDEAGEQRWRIWIDKESELAKGVPREKSIMLVKSIFGDDSVLENTDDYIEFNVSSHESGLARSLRDDPIAFIRGRVKAQLDSWNHDVKELRRVDPLAPDPPLPAAVSANQYVFLKGLVINNSTMVLNRLLVHPAINIRSTTTNNPYEIVAVRGIEAARVSIYREMYDLVSAIDKATINPRHIQNIVDVMTSTGVLMPITARGSVRRQQLGAYSESSFEQALQAFRRSAVSGASEAVSATSTSVLIGAQCVFGTGAFRVVSNRRSAEFKLPLSSATAELDKLIRMEEQKIPYNIGGDRASHHQQYRLPSLTTEDDTTVTLTFDSLRFPPSSSDVLGAEGLTPTVFNLEGLRQMLNKDVINFPLPKLNTVDTFDI